MICLENNSLIGEITMRKRDDTFTGYLKFREIDFLFVFDGIYLRLISPKDQESRIMNDWIMQAVAKGVFAGEQRMIIEESTLFGRCNENGQAVVFFVEPMSIMSHRNAVLIIKPEAYITFRNDIVEIDRIAISGTEINYIYPTYQAVELSSVLERDARKGQIKLATTAFDKTTSQVQRFIVDEKPVSVYFAVSRTVNYNKTNQSPLMLHSSIIFEFEATKDFCFIYQLWRIAKVFVQYLCYRQNVNMPYAELLAPYDDRRHIKVGELNILGEVEGHEEDSLEKGKYIELQYILGCEGKILSDIASDLLYTRHLPETYRMSNHINAARFILIAAAFEWEFGRAYPDGIPKNQRTVKIEDEIKKEIEEHIKTSTGKKKKKYGFLKTLIGTDPLQSKILHVSKDIRLIIDEFCIRVFDTNDEILSYEQMAQRLADQRNRFAHGDIDKDFINLTILDVFALQYIVYAMQLKQYGVDDKRIKVALHNLFLGQ